MPGFAYLFDRTTRGDQIPNASCRLPEGLYIRVGSANHADSAEQATRTHNPPVKGLRRERTDICECERILPPVVLDNMY